MKIIITERQHQMLKEAEQKTRYVVTFENVIDAVDDDDALNQLSDIHQKISQSTMDAEWNSKLETRVKFGETPRIVKNF